MLFDAPVRKDNLNPLFDALIRKDNLNLFLILSYSSFVIVILSFWWVSNVIA